MWKQFLGKLPRKSSKSDGSPGSAHSHSSNNSTTSLNGNSIQRTSSGSVIPTRSTTVKRTASAIFPSSIVTSIEPFLLFKDVPSTEKQNLFISKLNLCCVVFDFSDHINNSAEKDMKRQSLTDLIDYVDAGGSRFTEPMISATCKMFASNLFRPFPPNNRSSSTGGETEEEEPMWEPAWSHLQLVYDLLLKFIETSSLDAKIAKKYVDHSFIIRLLHLFDSEDPRERDCLKTILHRIYGKFMVHRPFIRKAVSNVFYQFVFETGRHNGIAELLEVFASVISGFALPLKEEHKLFLLRVLIPLHKPKTVGVYLQQLTYCVTQFVEKDPKLASAVVSGLLRYWPITNSQKEIMFLSELEEVLEATNAMELQRCMIPLFRRIGFCINSSHIQADTVDSKARQLQHTAQDENSDASCVIKERMSQALRYFKESTDQHILVQVWAPVKDGNRSILTTSGQPFVLHPQSTKLLQYRTASQMYIFSADEEDDACLGLPGRVFTKRMPEWTPNVKYYDSVEYQRLNHALLYDVQGTLALPVFEPSGQSCVAVVELVMTSQKINYAYDVGKVCRALEAVNLKSSEILNHPNVIIANDGRQAALAEILEIITVVCEAQKLPLAQTWVPCRHRTVLAQGGGLKKTCSSFDGSCIGQVCMSTTDVAFYVVDAHLWGFRDACAEHHLQKGQGVAGRAFALRRPYFSRDVTKYCKSEYPLVHYAKMFSLAGCLAICLRSIHSGDDDYILEFFLPADCKTLTEQQDSLKSISVLFNQFFQNLKVITDEEFQEGISLELADLVTDDNYEPQPGSLSSCDIQYFKSPGANICEAEGKNYSPDTNSNLDLHKQLVAPDPNVRNDGSLISESPSLSNKTGKNPGKRRGKAEKVISLEVLQQYFSGSLKAAAKTLGVCPTTMKRICRHHGISRWPSRKINKVNRSLSKLKHVIESVQESGALDLTSLACPLPVTGDSVPWPINLESLKDFNDGEKGKEIVLEKSYDRDDQQNKSVPKLRSGKCSRCSKTGSSSEDSMDAPISRGSCQGSPVYNDLLLSRQPNLSGLRQGLDICSSSKCKLQNARNQNLQNKNLPSAVVVESQPLVGLLIKDSASSKDLKNMCAFGGEASQEEPAVVLTSSVTKPWEMQNNRSSIIKANYKDDIIRFRLPHGAGVLALKDEISKRLKLEVGTFDIKYLDDDHEWVMLVCEADLEECMEISTLSRAHIIRLSVHDVVTNLGSSCGSSEFDHHNYAVRQFKMS